MQKHSLLPYIVPHVNDLWLVPTGYDDFPTSIRPFPGSGIIDVGC